ncbi:helix-turn-helix domain-containing protein [Vibrio litoralis]|uniref:helix-turn-helix domain-containing protein n=1 Tax=Vibrio litoralis TaxID=335972 RepID=UPI0003FA3971|nr:helix-turn-helix domain-containing protein [Vibrio litoralis]
MSVRVMSYVWDIPLFKGSDKLVMLCLADHADDKGICWPSIDTIARKSGVSPTTVKTTLKKLEAGGWLFKKNQFKKADTGRLVRSNNQYQLPVMLLKKKADEQTDFEQSNFVRSKVEHSKFEQTKQPEGVSQISAGGRAKSGYKPPIDPPIEPPSKDLVPCKQEHSNKNTNINDSVVEAYNEILGKRFVFCKALNDKRKRAIKKFLNELCEPTPEAAREYFNAFNAGAGDFYSGVNDRGWKASFDYVIRPDVMIRVQEGSLGGSVPQSLSDANESTAWIHDMDMQGGPI